jgi:hypothetical protein
VNRVSRAVSAGSHWYIELALLSSAVWVILQLIALLEGVAGRGRAMRATVHPVIVVIVV